MIKGIIFDFNGPIMTEEADAIFEKHSVQRGFDREAIKKLVKEYYKGAHVGEFKNFIEFFKKTKPSLSITIEEMNQIFEEKHLTMRISPKMIELISSLKKKYKIGLLTNFTADLEKFLKDTFNIYHLFDAIINSYDIKIEKPEAKVYLAILNKLGLKPEETIFIDDKARNIEGAKKVGMKAILYEDFDKFKIDLEVKIKEIIF